MAKEQAEKKPKVKRPTAQKRDIQNNKKKLLNKAFKSSVRTAVRSFEEAHQKGDEAKTKELLNEVYSLMDKGVKKGVYKINKASRTKARLTARSVAKV